MAKARQFGLLLWKNYTLQRRKKLLTLLEIGLPTFFSIILIFIRQRVIASNVDTPTEWGGFNLDTLPMDLCPTPPCFGGQKWRLFYSPDSNFTKSIMDNVKRQLNEERSTISDLVGVANESAMVDKILADFEKPDVASNILGGIVFTSLPLNGSTVASHIQYKIRLSSSPRNTGPQSFHLNPFKGDTGWKTGFMFPPFQKVGPRENESAYGGDPGYWREGFLSLQHNIDIAIIKQLNLTAYGDKVKASKPSLDDIKLKVKRFPYPSYIDDNFVLVIQQQLPLILMLSFVYSALSIVKDVVHEKERKLKELMKMMGLSNWLHWCTWFLQYFLLLFISSIIITVFFCVPVSEYGSVVGNTSPTVLLVFLLAYVVATINFCFAISVFFNKANSAAAAGGIFFFVSYIPYFFLQPRYDQMTWAGKVSSCLISNVGMAYGGQVIGMFEGTGAGVQWSNINQGISVDDDFTMLHVILMLLLDSVLYALLTWYVEAVWPGEYGIPRPWYFPFMKSYWCGVNLKSLVDDVGEETPLLRDQPLQQDLEFFEKEPHGMRAGIRIKKLKKVFGNGASRNVAVDGITLNLYEGQITALLGHNGAGKTTTMSMLTGFFPPTSGTAWVNGLDVRKDIDNIRSSLGLCPQQNVLFDTLTVEEHLVFFAKLKGYPSELVSEEVDRMLDDVGLTSKRHFKSQTLSGGMKRKLCVAIALVGGSQIVILDEPTSGMDPNARRQTWDILQHHRVGRTMVLTTHFMDEADLLGDRIAIMVDGQLQCCGSPLFLKKKYGAGYHMVIVKGPDCDVSAINDIVQSCVPDAQLESNISAELSFILPHESKQAFEHLFMQLELGRVELKIASFGVSVTTMEEVFLRVGERAEDTRPGPVHQSRSLSMLRNPASQHTLFHERASKNTGVTLYAQQFYAMFLKRILHTYRNWLITVSQLAVPLFFTISALVMLKTQPGITDIPALNLKLSRFGHTFIPYGSGISPTNLTQELSEVYRQFFEGKSQTLDYITNHSADHQMEQFLETKGKESLPTYNLYYIIAAEFQAAIGQNSVDAIAYFNNQAYHSPGVTVSIIDNVILRYIGGNAYTITTTNHPLPQTAQDMVNNKMLEEEEGFTISFNIMFGMSFVASSFVLFLIREQATRAKHCQFVSGVHSLTFWSATFCWDVINYMVPCLCLLATFAAFDIEAYVGGGRLWDVLLLFALYGWAMLPFMYVLSFIFTVPSSGLVWLTMFNILAGIATVLAVDILSIPQLGTLDLSRTLEWVFMVLLPNFCLGQGLNDFYTNFQFLQVCDTPTVRAICNMHLPQPFACCKDNCGDMCLDYEENYLSLLPGGIGRSLVFLAAQGFLYFIILFLIESRALQIIYYKLFSLKNSEKINMPHSDSEMFVQEDSDVTRECHRIASTSIVREESLVLQELTKYYGTMLAVDRLSVGIPQGECFGLLGINGAGKTTTFKMLTGDLSMTSGKAYLNGRDISSHMREVRSQLGYCPQFDALIDQLTGREMLAMYARLRGIHERSILSVVHTLLEALLLEEHADKLIATYSGGNKRKLSTALALIGDPPIIFLDEPTTGMDPVARRRTWDVLSRVRASGQTLVLTSHSMEECEALCTRLAIMVNGQFKCLGSTQHLKNKFGEGFTLIVKVGHTDEGDLPNTKPVMTFIERTFPGSVLKDIHQGLLHYHVTDANIPWASLFGSMERAKVTYNIEDYSISQTTLEQVFINFARAQVAPLEERAGRSQRCWSACGSCCATWCCFCCAGTRKHRHSAIDDDEPLLT